jgi:phenylpyruvate tautomerase PptA (4-oxalocrotonate tautomerase family)
MTSHLRKETKAMPIYQFAKEITRLHCEATQAPPSFVHVLFQELTAGAHYLGGQLDTKTTWINGLIRAGRPLAVRQQMMKNICQSWTKLTGQPVDQPLVNLHETDAS